VRPSLKLRRAFLSTSEHLKIGLLVLETGLITCRKDAVPSREKKKIRMRLTPLWD
jgi:hypothetical protein